MNGKITLAVIFAFIIVLSSFVPFYEKFRIRNVWEITDHPFFEQISKTTNEKFLIVGGSAVGQLNSTHINKVISETHPEYVVYNLAYNGDIPVQRLYSLESTISTNPKIIFYGISYWSFSDYYNVNNEDLLKSFFNTLQINPKATTLNAIRTIFGDETGLFPTQKYVSDTTPFFSYSQDQMTINEQSQLFLDPEITIQKVHQNPSTSEQLRALEETIELLQQKKIKVVFFTVPLHQSYLDIVPENDKILFDKTLKNLSEKYNIKIYDFTKSYSTQDVWKDSYHVALNPNSFVYSEDVAQMIISEAP